MNVRVHFFAYLRLLSIHVSASCVFRFQGFVGRESTINEAPLCVCARTHRRLHNLVTARQQDKASMNQLEKRLQEERKLRSLLEAQLSQERKAKKAEEAAAARAAVAMATARWVSQQTRLDQAV